MELLAVAQPSPSRGIQARTESGRGVGFRDDWHAPAVRLVRDRVAVILIRGRCDHSGRIHPHHAGESFLRRTFSAPIW